MKILIMGDTIRQGTAYESTPVFKALRSNGYIGIGKTPAKE